MAILPPYRDGMTRLRRLSPSIRLVLATLLTLCLAVRLLTPAGFMPSFAGGSLAIVECSEADGAHDGKGGFHQLCPYAQAASLAGIDPGTAALILFILLAALPSPTRALPTFRRRATRERPPSHAPPVPA